MKKWILLQILLSLGDILTTPWWDLSLEMNPIVQHGGPTAMILTKILLVLLFTLAWITWKNALFRKALLLVTTIPILLAIGWNLINILFL